jgi:hypothetical protein
MKKWVSVLDSTLISCMKSFFTLVFFLLVYIHAQCQGMMANVGIGYTFRCTFDAYHDTSNSYTASIKEDFKYSLDIGYRVDRNFSANLSLQYQNTTVHADVHYNANRFSPDLQVALVWIQGGGTSYFPANQFELFFGTYIGMGFYHFYDSPSSASKNNPVRFAWSVRGGMGYFINKRVGVNVRADALFSTDPLSEQYATPGLSNNKTGFNGITQLGVTSGITILLFKEGEKASK